MRERELNVMSSLFDDDPGGQPEGRPLRDGEGADKRRGGPSGPSTGTPLAERIRPRTLDEVLGQDAILAPGRPLREAIERDLLQSIIFWGPPGTGKTTLARIIAEICSKCRSVSWAISRATVVLPVPGGPQKIREPIDLEAISRVRMPSGPTR